MNGRVQDARTGVFLSPDPIMTDPQLTIAWNPYSYVYNAPLDYVDPSGFSRCTIVWGVERDREGNLVTTGEVLCSGHSSGGGGAGGGGGSLPSVPNTAPGEQTFVVAGLDYVDPSRGISDGQILQLLLFGYFEVAAYSDLGTRVLPDRVTIDQLQNGDRALWTRVRDRMIAEVIINAVAVAAPLGLEGRGVLAGAGGGGNLTRVGRWMSMQEFRQMSATGRVIEGAGGRTYVIRPPNPGSYTSARPGSVYAEFDVPTNVLKPGSKPDWAVIPGPNVTTRIYGPPPAEMPPATCIVCVIGQ